MSRYLESPEVKAHIDQLRKERCYWCNCKLIRWPRTAPNFRTKEHIIPKSLGGLSTLMNLTWACLSCNQTRKSDTSWVPYHERLTTGSECGKITTSE